MLDITQAELAAAVGVSRSHIAEIETGRTGASLDLAWTIADRLGIDLQLIGQQPIVHERRHGDLVHARCSGYVDRRFGKAAWLTGRELETVAGRAHGWIDLLAFEPRTRTLVIVEVKTRLDDIGAIERQVSWYERDANRIARQFGWHPRFVTTWLLVLASDEVERQISVHRELLGRTFPDRARSMRGILAQGGSLIGGRGLAAIDPTSRRQRWLIPTRVEGRRSACPFRDYAEAARRLGGPSLPAT
jgi:DNA-binding XRE family transcriptional regulator